MLDVENFLNYLTFLAYSLSNLKKKNKMYIRYDFAMLSI